MIDKIVVSRWARRDLINEILLNKDLTFDTFIIKCKADIINVMGNNISENGITMHLSGCYIAFIINRVDKYFNTIQDDLEYEKFLVDYSNNPIPLYCLMSTCGKGRYKSMNAADNKLIQDRLMIRSSFDDLYTDVSLFFKLYNNNSYGVNTKLIGMIVVSVMHLISINRKHGVIDNTLNNSVVNDILWVELPCMLYHIFQKLI